MKGKEKKEMKKEPKKEMKSACKMADSEKMASKSKKK